MGMIPNRRVTWQATSNDENSYGAVRVTARGEQPAMPKQMCTQTGRIDFE